MLSNHFQYESESQAANKAAAHKLLVETQLTPKKLETSMREKYLQPTSCTVDV